MTPETIFPARLTGGEMAKTIKKKGNKIIITEDITTVKEISALQKEKKSCQDVIASMNTRIANIDSLLAAVE